MGIHPTVVEAVIDDDLAGRPVGIAVLGRRGVVVASRSGPNGVVERRTVGVVELELTVGDNRVTGVGAGPPEHDAAVAPLFDAVVVAAIADDAADHPVLTKPGADAGIASEQHVA